MKTLEKILTILLFTSITVNANPNFVIATDMHLDIKGKLIQPDRLFMGEGIKAYRSGYTHDAFSYFKKAAALGNTLSQRYIGLMYINGLGVEKDMVKGYAWLKLAAKDESPKHIALEQQVSKLLSEEQLKLAKVEYDLVSNDYGVIAALTRRDRWVHKQKMKMTGSRTGSLVFAPLRRDTPHGHGLYNQIQAYVDDYNYGYVSSGEIIPIEKSEEEKK